ncbi:MAG: hypothetical protein SXV54_23120 [Chloroflexota bacterium]|nr:hypothetical protein [Chloroflexota bacterium]
MDDKFEYKFELLKQEMDTLQSGIRTYDGTLFTIKGWAITIFSAFIFFAADKQKPIFLAFCAMAIMLFWLLDSIYRSMQRIYIFRYNEIERFLQSPDFSQAVAERSFNNFRVPNVGTSFDVKGKAKYIAIFQAGIMLHNALLYIAMLVLVAGVAIALV